MNKAAVYHASQSEYAYAVESSMLSLKLRAAKNDVGKVTLIYGGKFAWHEVRNELLMEKSFTDDAFDYFTVTFTPPDRRVAYMFRLESDGREYYYSEEGVTNRYDFDKGYFHFFQFPEFNESDIIHVPEFASEAVAYQIFVERFCMGDTKKDTSYINLTWGDKPEPKSFAGGDLPGITKHLNDLQKLGVNFIYLTPVFTSPSNHKYDIIDYYQVDQQFGGNEALRELIQEAHKRGIRLMLDAVFNHISIESSLFQDVVKNGKKSRYFDWFFIDGDEVNLEQPNYKQFASVPYMPKLNTNNPEVVDYLCEVGRYWIREYDIDGWRLDVADEVSHTFWRSFRQTVKREKPESLIIGEIWHNPNVWVQGDQFDSTMNYTFTKACIDYFAARKYSAKQMAERLSSLYMRVPDPVNRMMLNLLDSHDTDRFLTILKGNVKRYLGSLALLYFYEGIPCIFSGDEFGVMGGYDPDCRRCYPWEKEKQNQEIYQHVTNMIALRKQRKSLREGKMRITYDKDVLIICRQLDHERTTLYLNQTGKASEIIAASGKKLVIPADGFEIECL